MRAARELLPGKWRVAKMANPTSESVIESMRDHYYHARRHCGCGVIEAIYRAIYAQATGRWPW